MKRILILLVVCIMAAGSVGGFAIIYGQDAKAATDPHAQHSALEHKLATGKVSEFEKHLMLDMGLRAGLEPAQINNMCEGCNGYWIGDMCSTPGAAARCFSYTGVGGTRCCNCHCVGGPYFGTWLCD